MPEVTQIPQGRPMGVRQLSTTYQPGSVSTVTEGAPVAGNNNPALGNILEALLANKLAATQAARQPAPMMDAAPMRAMAMDRLEEGRPGRDSGYDLQDENFKRAQQRDALLQMQARQNPAPMRMVTGPGIIPGYVQDTNAMNAYQRQAYLPKESAQAYGPEDERRARTRLANDATFDARLAGDRARTANGNFEY